MADTESDDLILVGVIGRPHGVRGEVKIVPETDDPARFQHFQSAVGRGRGADRLFTFTSVRIQTTAKGLTPIAQFEGVTGREQAEALRGVELYVPAELLPLEDGEFFLHDLIGLRIELEDATVVGKVIDVIELPASPAMMVDRPAESQILIPIIPEIVSEVDAEKVIVRLPDGFLES